MVTSHKTMKIEIGVSAVLTSAPLPMLFIVTGTYIY